MVGVDVGGRELGGELREGDLASVFVDDVCDPKFNGASEDERFGEAVDDLPDVGLS